MNLVFLKKKLLQCQMLSTSFLCARMLMVILIEYAAPQMYINYCMITNNTNSIINM